MSKRHRVTDSSRASSVGAPGGTGPRQPCPCGSGRRYKACHGSASGPAPVFVQRPFQGLASECDLVAMRELVPAATAPLSLAPSVDAHGREVVLCSLLPMAAPALVRGDGTVWLGLQVQHGYGDPSRDLGAVLLESLGADPDTVVGLSADPSEGPRLQEIVASSPLEVTVHPGFDFWLSDVEPSDEAAASLTQANAAVTPMARLRSVEAAYWVDAGTKEHLRWVMPYDEAPLLDALARMHAASRDQLVPGSRLVGMFRTHGLLAPVWDLPPGTGPDALEGPAETLGCALAEGVGDDTPLSAAERSARSGLTNRQVTIR